MSGPRKVVDEIAIIRCASGRGMIREEVWQSTTGHVVKYNLAFINHFLCRQDNGRVLGYDNSHGFHHRHFKGTVERIHYESYEALLDRFLTEVGLLREEKP